MTQTNTPARSLTLTRLMRAPAKRVYDAFLEPDAYAKWLPPNGYTGHVHHMDAKVGGTFRMMFASLDRSDVHSFGGAYLELTPYTRIVHTDKFETDDLSLQGEMRVTITFEEVDEGTRVTVLHEHLPPGPAGEGAEEGWGQSLDNLQRLVEL